MRINVGKPGIEIITGADPVTGGLNVVEWSESQGFFHCDSLKRSLEKNIRNERNGQENHYVIVGVTDSLDESCELAKKLEADRDQMPGTWVLEWNSRTGKYRFNTFRCMIEQNQRDYFRRFTDDWIAVAVGGWSYVRQQMRLRNDRESLRI